MAVHASFDPALFATTFGLVFISELPDKTAFATVVMASRRHPMAVFAGVAAAFLTQSLIAVICGGLLNLLPTDWVRAAASGLFFFFAWRLWTHPEVEEVEGAPGYYQSKFYLKPHYQLEGLTVSLRLVSKLPSEKTA